MWVTGGGLGGPVAMLEISFVVEGEEEGTDLSLLTLNRSALREGSGVSPGGSAGDHSLGSPLH